MDREGIIREYQNMLLRKYRAQEPDFDVWLDALARGSSSVQTGFKYEEEVVRGRKRENMHGESCECCREYFSEDVEGRNRTSRHRREFPRPPTPPGFWKMDF